MDISQRGIDLIVGFEGKHKDIGGGKFRAYLDTLAKPPVWTIYCGLTRGVHEGMIVSVDDGDKMFSKELTIYEDAVERLISVPINQNQFDALVSYCYNCGIGALEKSTLRRVLNQGKYEQVPAQLMRWVHAGGVEYAGLVRRRQAEGALFMEPIPTLDQIGTGEDRREEPASLPMPQRVEEKPAARAIDAVKESWTIKGAVLAALATIADKATSTYDWLFSVAQDAGPEVMKLKTAVGPFDALLVALKTSMPMLMALLTILGIGVVITRRVSAAKEGKIG